MIKEALRRIVGFPVYTTITCKYCDYEFRRTFWYVSTSEWLEQTEVNGELVRQQFDEHECEVDR